jgi:hypothetical protein
VKEDGVLDETCKDMEKVKKFQKMLDMLGLRKILKKSWKIGNVGKVKNGNGGKNLKCTLSMENR